MKKPVRRIPVFRGLMLGVAALALYLPVKNLPKADADAVSQTQVKLPQGIQLASAQTSWQAVFSAGY